MNDKADQTKTDPTPSAATLAETQARKLLADHLYRLADLSYNTEKEREAKLNDLCVQLLTCITILSVAFLTPAPFLFECYATSGGTYLAPAQIKLAWMYAIVLVPLVICIFLILRARALKQMNVLDSPEKQAHFADQLLAGYTADNPEYVIDELALAKNYCRAMQGTFEGMRRKHDKMWDSIQVSMILVAISCACALLFGLHLLLQLT